MRRVFIACLVTALGCEFPRPTPFGKHDGGTDSASESICVANQALRCDGTHMVRCNSDGTAELSESCVLGCSAADLRCLDVAPSNGLAMYVDLAADQQDIDLGTSATINTNDGTIVVDGQPITVRNALVAQTSAPTMLVLIVRSLRMNDVTIVGGSAGGNAFVVVSDGEIKVGGVLAASGHGQVPGPGRFNDAACAGRKGATAGAAFGGGGGGGFGTDGGKGGAASSDDGSAAGGAAGKATGNPLLVPLRGGCDGSGSPVVDSSSSGGGGAIQLVSRTKITITGVVAANGAAVEPDGGGSGGGILLEAPVIEATGTVVANGGGGASGCLFSGAGEDGHLDASPASGGRGCPPIAGDGGNGAAGAVNAGDGAFVNVTGSRSAFGGSGGGGVGRIRINTAPGGFHRAGLFSPNPSTGTVAVR